MRTHLDAKLMARSLRERLAGRDVTVSHGEALELVAGQFGLADWNTLAARIAADAGPDGASSRSGPSPSAAIAPRAAVPIVRIFSVEPALAFYVGYLGFTLDWEHRFEPGMPLYAQISRGATHLHLSEHHGDGTPGTALFIPMTGLAAFHRELAGRGYANLRPGIDQDGPGGPTMTLLDPFGNQLRFCDQPDVLPAP